MDPKLRLGLNQQVNVVGHDFHLDYSSAPLAADFRDDLLEPPIHTLNQDLAPVLGTPNDAEFAVETDVAIAAHRPVYSQSLYTSQPSLRLSLAMPEGRGIRALFAEYFFSALGAVFFVPTETDDSPKLEHSCTSQ
jgi:hypothetical protein